MKRRGDGGDKLAWMPLWVDDYLSATTHLSTLEHGAYLLLIMAYWRRRGPLPDDPAALARVAGLQPAAWRKVEPTLRDLFAVDGGHWRHARVDRELAEASDRISAATARTAAATAARSGGRNVTCNVTSPVTTLATDVVTPDVTLDVTPNVTRSTYTITTNNNRKDKDSVSSLRSETATRTSAGAHAHEDPRDFRASVPWSDGLLTPDQAAKLADLAAVMGVATPMPVLLEACREWWRRPEHAKRSKGKRPNWYGRLLNWLKQEAKVPTSLPGVRRLPAGAAPVAADGGEAARKRQLYHDVRQALDAVRGLSVPAPQPRHGHGPDEVAVAAWSERHESDLGRLRELWDGWGKPWPPTLRDVAKLEHWLDAYVAGPGAAPTDATDLVAATPLLDEAGAWVGGALPRRRTALAAAAASAPNDQAAA